MAHKPTEIGIQRTAPDAAALVVERTIDGSGRRAEAVPGQRRHTVVGVAMLAIGVVMTLAAVVVLGSRIGATAEAVRGTGLDAASVYFLGTAGSGAELAFVIAMLVLVLVLVLVPVGVALAVLGYRRVTDGGPSAAAMHVSNAPNAIIGRHAPNGS